MSLTQLDESARRRAQVPPWAWWGLGLALALALDRTVCHLVAPYAEIVRHGSEFFDEAKELGEYWLTIVVAVVLWRLHPIHWRAAAIVLASGALSGLLNSLLKWTAGRIRPVVAIDPWSFNPFANGLHGLFKQHNLSFPSGHTTLAFSTAAALAFLCPRGRSLWFGLAALTGLERVGELAHYPSDVVAGAMVGLASFVCVREVGDWLDARRPKLDSAEVSWSTLVAKRAK